MDSSSVIMWCSEFIGMNNLPAKPRLDSNVLSFYWGNELRYSRCAPNALSVCRNSRHFKLSMMCKYDGHFMQSQRCQKHLPDRPDGEADSSNFFHCCLRTRQHNRHNSKKRWHKVVLE